MKPNLPFNSHLFPEATEVGEVGLWHFVLGAFLRGQVRNLTRGREMMSSDQSELPLVIYPQ